MKKIFTFILLCVTTISANAQKKMMPAGFRSQRPEETAYLNQLHTDLFNSLPHTYKDWVTSKEDTFDALKYWCTDPGSWDKCMGCIPLNIGKGDPYTLDWQVEFNMSDTESMPIIVGATKMIKDFTNGPQVAAAIKSTDKTKLKIFIVANLDGSNLQTFRLIYCAKTPPQKITLPVPSTLAVMGIRSTQCPIMESGAPNLSGNYYDNAIIFLGKPAIGKKTITTSDNLTEDDCGIAFDSKLIGKMVVQNIAVTFKGDAADIQAAIKLIDWQKLYSLIQKP